MPDIAWKKVTVGARHGSAEAVIGVGPRFSSIWSVWSIWSVGMRDKGESEKGDIFGLFRLFRGFGGFRSILDFRSSGLRLAAFRFR